MADVAVIIGNGFDIDMGLPSKYSDFIKSREWHDVVKNLNSFLQVEAYQRHSLVGQLQEASKDSQWFDIEEEIHKFVVSHPNNSRKEIGDIRNEFELVKNALAKYLKRISDNFKADKNKLAAQIIDALYDSLLSVAEIYFNYTSPHLFLDSPRFFRVADYTLTYVHGNLNDNDIVLGCDLQKGEKVNRQLSFMYKYNMLKKANHVAQNILESKEIIFFGHSLNEMDFGYFREFFKAASASHKPFRSLTIITYDEESERNIKDNIRNQGISVTDLYNNLLSFDFIHTKDVYNQDDTEQRKWYNFKDRLFNSTAGQSPCANRDSQMSHK